MFENRKNVLVLIIAIVAIVGFVGYKSYKHQQDQQYWSKINSSSSFQGDGYKAVFPCTDITTQNYHGSDLDSKTSTCSHFNGDKHTEIDMYSIEVEHFVSDKYSPSEDVSCADPNHFTNNVDTQTYYSEARFVDGVNIIICGKGKSPVYAKIRQGNTVYTLTVSPSVEKTTRAKLDVFISSFQLLK